eukprot:1451126-Lingulodinium_polyedra.AAC.1
MTLFETRPEAVARRPSDRGEEGEDAFPEAPDFARPWAGEEPPQGGTGFVRRKDGVWCRPDSPGRLYKVDAYGER